MSATHRQIMVRAPQKGSSCGASASWLGLEEHACSLLPSTVVVSKPMVAGFSFSWTLVEFGCSAVGGPRLVPLFALQSASAF